ncbi:jg3934 [Pararge aegeria aegeria]|uniref:Jg3934 protein n=1 Tax=Pararge aegeria aegeria TaxID=348720 RepID=A0A8S4RT94_9NEOP|nr:jg3934 [Pararge aegeria aegeria]
MVDGHTAAFCSPIIQLGHVDGRDALERRQPLQALAGLLLHRNEEGILDNVVADVRHCNNRTYLYVQPR